MLAQSSTKGAYTITFPSAFTSRVSVSFEHAYSSDTTLASIKQNGINVIMSGHPSTTSVNYRTNAGTEYIIAMGY